jgi:catechol 2,3-dioxygenase-like lactoylglutathione lyase family enzyme
MELDHITAFVGDVEAAASALERVLGAPPAGAVVLPGMTIRTFRIGEAEVHLNAPTGPGPVLDFYRAHGAALHHIALRVDDLDRRLGELERLGLRAAGAPIETAPGLREVFLDPATTGGVMLQLVERRRTADATVALDDRAVAALAAQGRERQP